MKGEEEEEEEKEQEEQEQEEEEMEEEEEEWVERNSRKSVKWSAVPSDPLVSLKLNLKLV